MQRERQRQRQRYNERDRGTRRDKERYRGTKERQRGKERYGGTKREAKRETKVQKERQKDKERDKSTKREPEVQREGVIITNQEKYLCFGKGWVGRVRVRGYVELREQEVGRGGDVGKLVLVNQLKIQSGVPDGELMAILLRLKAN